MPAGFPCAEVTHPWVYRASITQIIAITVAFWLSAWALDSGFDLLWAKYGRIVAAPMAVADALVAMMFAVVVLRLMLLQRARHSKAVRQLIWQQPRGDNQENASAR